MMLRMIGIVCLRPVVGISPFLLLSRMMEVWWRILKIMAKVWQSGKLTKKG